MNRDTVAETVQCRPSDPELLATVLKLLPIAIALFDQRGRFIVRSGALRTMLGDVLPSRDPNEMHRWSIYDDSGSPIDPPNYPGARALRGETVIPGVDASYAVQAGRHRWLRISAAPYDDGQGLTGGVVLLQDIDQERRALDKLLDDLSARFVDTLFGTLLTIAGQASHLDSSAAQELVRRTLGFPPTKDTVSTDGITEREVEVLKLVAWGKTHKEISFQLGISEKTVEFHKARAIRKLHLHSRSDIVRYAVSHNWLRENTYPEGAKLGS